MLLNSFILTGLFIVSCLVVQTFANGAIRLVDGNDASEGRVEVLQNGQWGTICDDGWDIADAHVVCRQLGLGYAVSASGQGRFGRGSGAIAMDEVNCAGNEERLEDCSFRGWFLHDCIHQEDAGVRCSTADGGLRLVGGNSIHEGRVEYYRGGAWGTICDDNWDENDAAVACRSLGFSQPAVAFDSAHFGEGTGAIVLSNVDCDGTETSLDECNEKQGSVIDCLHSEDAGVRCTPILISTTPRCSDYDIRIRGGTAVSDGLVEVCYKGFWGTVCANSWKKEDAFAVCRQLGYNVVETFYSRVSSNNVPDQTVGHLSCRAGSVTLSNCDLTFGYQDGCSLNAGVTCAKEERCVEGQVQLVGGNSASSGRVQFCQAGETVNICGTSWEYNEARLVCRQLGYSSVSDYSSVIANHGIVSNSALRVLSCQGTEVSLSQCHIRPDSYCTRQATVTCGRQNGGGNGNGNGNDDVINDNDDRGSSTVVVYALPPSLLGVIIFLCLCYLWCWCNSGD